MATTNVATTAGIYAPPAAASRALEPVAPSERIHGLDLLRGWAMFGVLWSNLNDWYGTTDPATRFDRMLRTTQDWWLESRFYSLLCVLFGVGFAIQFLRATERGISLRGTYTRRSAALLAIGLAHALLVWQGDILTMYALVSFALLLFRDLTPRRQLAWAFGLHFLSTPVIDRARWLAGLRYMVPAIPQRTANWIYGHGTIAQIAHERVLEFTDWWGRWGLTGYFYVLSMFLAGSWALRSGFFQRVVSDRRATLRFLIWCIVIASAQFFGGLLLDRLLPRGAPQQQTTLTVMLSWRRLVHAPFDQVEAMAFAYAAMLLLIFQTPRGKRVLAPLVSTGRMALTTYLTQSVVCVTLFHSWGFGWYGRVGYTGMFAITLSLFAIQMAVSSWWLRRYRFGPVEWLWRTITYGRAPAMRVA